MWLCVDLLSRGFSRSNTARYVTPITAGPNFLPKADAQSDEPGQHLEATIKLCQFLAAGKGQNLE